jgi:hypothetical protein
MVKRLYNLLGVIVISATFFMLGYIAGKQDYTEVDNDRLFKARLMNVSSIIQDTMVRIPYTIARAKFDDYKRKRSNLFSSAHKKYSEYDLVEISDLNSLLQKYSQSGKYLVIRKGIQPQDNKEINTYMFVVDENYDMLIPSGFRESGNDAYLIMDDLIRCPPTCPESLN